LTSTYSEEHRRYVADCEGHDDHVGVPPFHHHDLILRRDLSVDATPPKDVIIWAVWMGGFKEIRSWPWNAEGLAAAQAWCDEHGAKWRHNGFPVRPDSLAVHATAV
jgi:hypothetical protein